MKLGEYFENTEGLGILATADKDGRVNVAVYARPHVIDKDTIAFICADNLTHRNLQSNPHAAYIFVEKGPGYKGRRLYLTKERETDDQKLIESLRKKRDIVRHYSAETKTFAVYFKIDHTRPAVGH